MCQCREHFQCAAQDQGAVALCPSNVACTSADTGVVCLSTAWLQAWRKTTKIAGLRACAPTAQGFGEAHVLRHVRPRDHDAAVRAGQD